MSSRLPCSIAWIVGIMSAVAVNAGCRVKNEKHCGSKMEPTAQLLKCTRNNPGDPDAVWACTDRCFDSQNADGCYRVSYLLDQGIEEDDRCVIAWPQQFDADESGSDADSSGDMGEVTGDSLTLTLTTSGAEGSGTTTTAGTSATSTGTSGTHDDGTGSGDEGDTTGSAECTLDEHCKGDPRGPYCEFDTGNCVACRLDEHCPGEKSLCLPASKTCKEFECLDNSHCDAPARPVCGSNHECKPCDRVAGQCDAQAACDTTTGRCFNPAAPVFYVSKGGFTCQSDNPGDIADPFCEVDEALARLEAQGSKQATLIISSSDGSPLTSDADISGAMTKIALIGIDSPRLSGSGDEEGLRATDGAQVFVSGVHLTGAEESGAECKTGAELWIEDSLITHNGEHGIDAVDCELTLRRNEIHSNFKYGISAELGQIDVANTMIVSNGDSARGGGGIACLLCNLDMTYTTIADNRTAMGASQLACSIESNTVELRNSILMGAGEKGLACDILTAGFSLTDAGDLGPTNVYVADPPKIDWFRNTTTLEPDYRLRRADSSAVRELKSIAKVRNIDPTTDIDGTIRPPWGNRDYPGAHIAQ